MLVITFVSPCVCFILFLFGSVTLVGAGSKQLIVGQWCPANQELLYHCLLRHIKFLNILRIFHGAASLYRL